MLGKGGIAKRGGGRGVSSAPVIQLLPYNSAVYAWDDADRRDRKLVVETAKRDTVRGIRAGELIGEVRAKQRAENTSLRTIHSLTHAHRSSSSTSSHQIASLRTLPTRDLRVKLGRRGPVGS